MINPIRYRGYFYDEETGLYYLNSRYYDPEIERFINADGIICTGPTSINLNLYLYCTNNPIIYYDSNGYSPNYALSDPYSGFYDSWRQSHGINFTLSFSKGNRKPGKTPPTQWPQLPENLGGKKPKWNPQGYWEGKNGDKLTWDSRSHGSYNDWGNGPPGGHWDSENGDGRWDKDGNPIGGSKNEKAGDEKSVSIDSAVFEEALVSICTIGLFVIGVIYLISTGDATIIQRATA